jgi:hypothetical protein
MLLSRFPEEIIQKYNLNALAVDGWVYIEIQKGMYGLKQAGPLGEPITSNSSGTIWILPSPAHPGTMVTQDLAYFFHAR